MRKEKTYYPIDIDLFDDYKMQWILREEQKNWESLDKWLYLGADGVNKRYAKIGITMGDLRSRSYSSANPNYFIFCAFKCIHNISKEKLKAIENDILFKFTHVYVNNEGYTKRLIHVDSGRLSECFDGVDFNDFLWRLHYELFHHHSSSFITGVLYDRFDHEVGDILDIQFNEKLVTKVEQQNFRSLIAQ
ncbi:hypothetical protein [Pseudescherichia sp.]|uniref:hypothetical protein n=1 Tax=Pseudescherichia sp. TaxID=2055881 RepID=UPI0028A6E5D0|nr:hypothetical protein [Pseudescherichia sp.]